MSEYLANRDGGKTDENGLVRTLSQVIGNDVVQGALVTESVAPAMSVVVKPGDITVDSGLGYRYCGWTDADKTLTISTANATNPRKDLVIAYIDKSVVQSSTSNNINALKLAVIAGTAAASPVEPTSGTIQTAIGAGNPYEILALVDVPANDTIITKDQITDRRGRVPNLERIRQFIDTENDFWQTGCAIAVVSGLNVSLTAGIVWIDGVPVDVSLISSIALTATRDNYVDVDRNGVVYVTPVTVNTASPALTSSRLRIGIVTTDATTVTNINQGEALSTLPVVSNEILNISDSLGNMILPQKSQKILASRRRTSLFTTSSGTDVAITGLSATVKIPLTVRRVKLKLQCRAAFNDTAGCYCGLSLFKGSISAANKVGQQYSNGTASSATFHVPFNSDVPVDVTPGSTVTFLAGAVALSGGIANLTTESVAGRADITLTVEVA
jgi:hypothetical protein